MNRRCVVLAADNGTPSGNTSGTRIFEISSEPPVGLMVHGRDSIGGVPVEVLADEFSKRMTGCFFENMEEYARAFLSFLDEGRVLADDAPSGPVVPLAVSAGELAGDIAALWDTICGYCSDMPFPSEYDENVPVSDFEISLDMLLDELLALDFGFDPELRGKLGMLFDENVDRESLLFSLQMEDCYTDDMTPYFDRLLELFILALSGGMVGNLLDGTDLVFAGYGEGALLPSLVECGILGHYFGMTSYSLGSEYGAASGRKAAVLPFDLSPRLERFLMGIDREAGDDMAEMVSCRLADEELPGGRKLDDAEIEALTQIVEDEIDDLNDSCRGMLVEYVRDLSKGDTAAAAEFLVSMNSFGWVIDTGADSGGDVDVVVLSREDGFVWF